MNKTKGLSLLYSEKKLDKRVSELAYDISKNFEARDPIIIGVLNGSFIFLADLSRKLSINCEIDFIKVHSYSGKKSTGKVQLAKDISVDITNRHVILVEDIIDSGNTIKYLRRQLQSYKPKSISIAALLIKPNIEKLDFPIDFIGFEVKKEFVVGYGLDLDHKFRNLDGIYILNQDFKELYKKEDKAR